MAPIARSFISYDEKVTAVKLRSLKCQKKIIEIFCSELEVSKYNFKFCNKFEILITVVEAFQTTLFVVWKYTNFTKNSKAISFTVRL